MRRIRPSAAALLAAATLGLLFGLVLGPGLGGLAGPAGAASVDLAIPRGDGSVDVVLALEAGCPSVTEVVTSLPRSAAVIAAEEPSGWTHAIESTRITWRGPATAAGAMRLVVTARISVEPGETVLLPTRQRCSEGTVEEWTGPGAQDERPAPRLVATASTVDAGAAGVPATTSPGASPTAVSAAVGLVVSTGRSVRPS